MSRLSRLSLLLCLITAPLAAQNLPVTETNLPNGFKVLLVPRKGEPVVAGGWVVRVGSSNERPGITGIAHLFEHMMFKGTPTLGTKDYAKDKEIMAKQEEVRTQMRAEEAKLRAAWRRGEVADPAKPEAWSPRYQELRAEFQKLVQAQREVLVKNEFDRVYSSNGGSQMNAFTSTDMTAYYIQVPANKLELWMWMESERLLRPVFREFYAERDVVFEERRMRAESTPLGRFLEAYQSMIWTSHPYSWPTLGWPSDIPAISKSDADTFYATYYQPRNITIILVGDFEPAAALEQLNRYFGRIPAGTTPVPDVNTLEVAQVAEQRLNGEAETNPQVWITWHTVPFQHPDSYPLEVMQELLNNRTGRLYKALVLGSQVATEVFAAQDSRKWAGSFIAGGEARDGHTPEEVEAGVCAEIDKLAKEDVPPDELQKVKNNFAAAQFRKLAGNMPILQQLIRNEGTGDWREINAANARYQAVTTADIRRVASTYFNKNNRNVGVFLRKAANLASADKPAESLTGDEAKQVGTLLMRVKQEKDPAQLRTMLADVSARADGADPAKKKFWVRLQRAVETRLKEVEGK